MSHRDGVATVAAADDVVLVLQTASELPKRFSHQRCCLWLGWEALGASRGKVLHPVELIPTHLRVTLPKLTVTDGSRDMAPISWHNLMLGFLWSLLRHISS
jgi:hypothetical protein